MRRECRVIPPDPEPRRVHRRQGQQRQDRRDDRRDWRQDQRRVERWDRNNRDWWRGRPEFRDYRGARWDRDGDGVPTRYDRVYNPRWDRDGDGVPNRYDRYPRGR